jgi:D-3-phosphoglycerate dehydrogenase
VGNLLGKAGVNIRFMNVAPLEEEVEEEGKKSNEALMILGVDRPVGEEVARALIGPEGVLEASVVTL